MYGPEHLARCILCLTLPLLSHQKFDLDGMWRDNKVLLYRQITPMGQISPKFLVPPIGETTSRINAKFGGDLRTAGDGKVGYYVCHA